MSAVKTEPRSKPGTLKSAPQSGPITAQQRSLLQLVSTLCSIGIVRDGSGTPTGLKVFPRTPAHPVIYHPSPDKAHPGKARPVSPENPEQVIWTVKGLEPNEWIRIQRKSVSPQAFAWDATGNRSLTPAAPLAMSGPPSKLQASDGTVAWEYEVDLLDSSQTVLVHLDPVIIIDPEP
jgi:hypothetical protein